MFRVNPATGWVEMRTDMWDQIMAVRERAAIGPTQLLAAVPSKIPGKSAYVLVSRSAGAARRLLEPPVEADGIEAMELWYALAEEFDGELGEPR